jgi:hypothetical protein
MKSIANIKLSNAGYYFTSVFVALLATSIFTLNLDSSLNAILLIVVSFANMISVRRSFPLFLLFITLFYFNYSIAMGEYSALETAGAALNEVKTDYIYSLAIFVVLIFNTMLLGISPPRLNSIWTYSYDRLIVTVSLVSLVIIFLFYFDRSDISGYSVRVTPVYEYSVLLFLTSVIYSGNRTVLRAFILVFCFIFIANDFVFGGRVTSVQILLLLALTIFSNSLTVFRTVLLFLMGVVLMAVVGAYRGTFLLSGFDIGSVLSGLLENGFVFDTVVYAYYSSATHLASLDYVSWTERLNAFADLVVYLISGYESNGRFNLTSWVSSNYFANVGGGVLPSHFYFYFGIIGVIGSGLILRVVLFKLASSSLGFSRFALIIIVMMSPRWYLYTPVSLVRPLIFFSLIYFSIAIYKRMVKNNILPNRKSRYRISTL